MLAEIWRYPVKSCGGERIGSVTVGVNGLDGDRAWAAVDVENGLVASAKRPDRWKALLTTSVVTDGSTPVLSTPDGRSASTADPQALALLLSELTGRQVLVSRAADIAEPTLSRTDPDLRALLERGEVQLTTAVDGELSGAAPTGTVFDYAPVHVISTATLAAIEAEGGDTAGDARRFRANLVLDIDGPAFQEAGWQDRSLAIGDNVVLDVFMQSPRCAIPTLAQAELPRSTATARAVAALNRIDVEDLGTYVCAGAYAAIRSGGMVQEGDDATVIDNVELHEG